MALVGVEQDHARTISLAGKLVRALNTPDQADGSGWDWSYSLLHRRWCKEFWLTVRGGCGSLTTGLDVNLHDKLR